MKLRKIQAHPDSNAIIKAEVEKLNYTCYSVTNAVIIPLHPTKGGPVSSKAPQWFQEWSDQIFAPFVKEMKEFKGEVVERLDSLEHKVDAILECPTIKKEIKL